MHICNAMLSFMPEFLLFNNFMGLRGIEWAKLGYERNKAVHFLAILDFGVGFDLASERDDKNGEASSATL